MKHVYLQTHSFRSGIVTTSSKEYSLTIVVLPKAWKNRLHKYGSIDTMQVQWKEQEQYFCFYENQYVQIQMFEEGESNAIIEKRHNILKSLLKEVHKKNKSLESDRMELEGEMVQTTMLRNITKQAFYQNQEKHKKNSSNLYKISDEAEHGCDTKEDVLESILKLLSLLKYSGFTNPPQSQVVPTSENMLQPLLHYRFVQEMESNIRYIRRNYIPKSENLGTVRGQIESLSAARTDVSGETLIRCNYDEFEEGTILMRVLITALEIVSVGNWLTNHRQNDKKNQTKLNLVTTQNRAIQLRRFLFSIPSFERRVACQKSKQVRMNRLNQMFSKALQYAKLILENKSLLYVPASQHTDVSWCWEIDMSKVWERILFSALQQLEKQKYLLVMYYENDEGTKIYPPKKIKGPFGVESISKPDLLVSTLDLKQPQNWILDAKYSYYWELSHTINSNYRDQMFRYLYLMSEDQAKNTKKSWKKCRKSQPWAHQLALLYTTDSQSIVESNKSELQGIWQWSNSYPSLHQHVLPFPNSYKDISSINNWNLYIAHIAKNFSKLLQITV